MSRFDYVQYDARGCAQQAELKILCQRLEAGIQTLKAGRSTALALTSLEEAYMWIGKAIRDEQVERNGTAPLQEQRTNS